MLVGHTDTVPGNNLGFLSILIATNKRTGESAIFEIKILLIIQQFGCMGLKPVIPINFKS
jgi:hypothetical protein